MKRRIITLLIAGAAVLGAASAMPAATGSAAQASVHTVHAGTWHFE